MKTSSSGLSQNESASAAALAQAGGSVKLAVLMLKSGLAVDAARARLEAVQGDLRAALDA